MDNNKLAIIHPDGSIKLLGDKHDEDELHVACMLDYASEKYPEASIFQKLNIRHRPLDVAYFYTLLGDIIITNNTSQEKKYGKTGTVFMPNEITEMQKESLYEFAPFMDNYVVDILYDMEIKDGIIDGQQQFSSGSFTENLNAFFDKRKAKK